MSDDLEAVVALASQHELLCQCAEESAELAQAALKVKRSDEYTTGLHREEALANLEEETADVLVTIAALHRAGMIDMNRVEDIEARKLERWSERLWLRGTAPEQKAEKERDSLRNSMTALTAKAQRGEDPKEIVKELVAMAALNGLLVKEDMT